LSYLLFLFLLTLAVGVAHELVNEAKQDSVHHVEDEFLVWLLLRWWFLVWQILEDIVVALKQLVNFADRNFFVPCDASLNPITADLATRTTSPLSRACAQTSS
jgi:hypothetical protein